MAFYLYILIHILCVIICTISYIVCRRVPDTLEWLVLVLLAPEICILCIAMIIVMVIKGALK